uniref:p-selectin n=1 Tax=Terrapene triunguis TaxID=2587831 RepID=A0A674KFQ1_9SAUR
PIDSQPIALSLTMEVGAWTYHYGNKSDYSWELARNFCRLFYTDLVAIQNQGEIVYLNNVLPRHRTYYWIGIRKINNVWTWVGTNKALTKEAENWANREPNNKGKNQDCVEIYIKRDHDAGRWNDENCQKKKRALCYQASCQRSSCSQRGECVETIGNYSCDCYPGFYGPECEHVVRCKNLDPRPDCSHPLGEFSYNSTCKFQCQEGFELQGLDTLQCLASGNWTAAAPECAVLATPGRGRLNCTHWHGDFTYNSTCTFSCEMGFVRNGSETLACTALGQWTVRPPLCEAVKCPVLDSPGRGRLNCTHWHGDFTYNSTCAFSCETGFVRNGLETLECTALGQWKGRPPRCEGTVQTIHCRTGLGSCFCSCDFTDNSTCTFLCKMGFVQNGSEMLECMTLRGTTLTLGSTAESTGSLPAPILMNCSHPLESFSYGSVCRFRCTQGYFLNGTSRVQCQPDGHWSDKMPACQGKLFCHVLASMWSSAFPLQWLTQARGTRSTCDTLETNKFIWA